MDARASVIAIATLCCAGCDNGTEGNRVVTLTSPASPPPVVSISPTPAAPPPRPRHNYELREGTVYSYIAAVSEEEAKTGKAAGDVLMYRYLGLNDGIHTVTSVDGYGNNLNTYTCADPCVIIKSGPRRIAYSPSSMIGAVFQDAMNGHLEPFRNPYPVQRSSLPKRFVGEWNADLSACGTGLSDSRLRLSPKSLAFYESEGAITSVEMLSEDVAKVRASLSGEGSTWTETFTFTLADNGRRLSTSVENVSFDRKRCAT